MALSRITTSGVPNLIRNRGDMASVFNMNDNVSNGYLSPSPCTRVTEASVPNQIKGRGAMEKYLNMDDNIRNGVVTSRPCSRITDQSQPNYIKGQGTVQIWLNVEENLSSGYETHRPVPHCPSEISKTMYEKGKGTMTDYIGANTDYRPLPIEKKIHPRGVPKTAESNSIPHKGKRMEMIIHNAASMPESARPWGRTIKPETEHIAEKHRGKPVAQLINNYGTLPASERAPRVTVWGEDNMALNRGGRAKKLINDQQKPLTERPLTSEGLQSTNQNWCITERQYGSKLDNYNKRNATQWTMT